MLLLLLCCWVYYNSLLKHLGHKQRERQDWENSTAAGVRSHFDTRAQISNADSNVVSFTIKVAGRKSHRFLILVLLGKRLLVAMKTECSSHSE